MGELKPIKVISAEPLDGASKMRIELVFAKKHKEHITFEYIIKPDIIGGIMINDNEIYYDATIKGQLDKIKNLL